MMCIQKVEAWDHGGKLFPTEEEALFAAVNDIAAKIQKDHSHRLHEGLLAHSEQLRRVLGRLDEIEQAKPKVEAAPVATFVDDAVAEAA